ncbi:MAG: glucosyl transferase family 2 [Verrucomicrobia bacterium]|nr:glucosyl transferase family 2 [Verrucomicrobiota bacterium]
MQVQLFDPAQLEPGVGSKRRFFVGVMVLLVTIPAIVLMADLHLRTGYDGWKLAHLVIFAVLFTLLVFGAMQAVVGYMLRVQGGDTIRISQSVDWAEDRGPLEARTAVVMPICNEEAGRVMEGVRLIYESLEADGRLPGFDFFILSDSNDPNCWVAEEVAWAGLVKELGAAGRLFYRKRRGNVNKKAGNIADFCRRWGSQYRYMVVLDADSIMTGGAIVALARMMERNPGVGLIQAVPRLVNGETIFARLQQFASRLYGPVFTAGTNYWQLSEANYWGHNAIIRLAPFIKHCSLPELPGDGPFGGRIMSHDYVEAALMRRAGWQVWLAASIEGSFEECPANLIDFAKRDRRWLQGNLQHLRLVFGPGFHPLSRMHFAMGILSYLASPLWLAFLVLSTAIAWRFKATGLTPLPVDSFAELVTWRFETQAVLLLSLTLGLLFVPKIFALLDLRSRPEEVAAFGGWLRLIAGIFIETILFTLLAPVLMLFHSTFIVLTLCRRSVGWKTQRRGRDGQSDWRESTALHGTHTLIGIGWLALAWWINPMLAAWMSPILAGFILSITVSYFTGRIAPGLVLKRAGLLTCPEESRPPNELVRLEERLAERHRQDARMPGPDAGLVNSVADPYVNAVHLSQLRAKDNPAPANEARFAELRRKLLRQGPAALAPRDKLALMMDAESMTELHRELWASSTADVAPVWQQALTRYSRAEEKTFPGSAGELAMGM